MCLWPTQRPKHLSQKHERCFERIMPKMLEYIAESLRCNPSTLLIHESVISWSRSENTNILFVWKLRGKTLIPMHLGHFWTHPFGSGSSLWTAWHHWLTCKSSRSDCSIFHWPANGAKSSLDGWILWFPTWCDRQGNLGINELINQGLQPSPVSQAPMVLLKLTTFGATAVASMTKSSCKAVGHRPAFWHEAIVPGIQVDRIWQIPFKDKCGEMNVTSWGNHLRFLWHSGNPQISLNRWSTHLLHQNHVLVPGPNSLNQRTSQPKEQLLDQEDPSFWMTMSKTWQDTQKPSGLKIGYPQLWYLVFIIIFSMKIAIDWG